MSKTLSNQYIYHSSTPEKWAQLVANNARAKEILAALKEAKKGSKKCYILCVGLHGYDWAVRWCRLDSTPNRAGQYESILDIIEDAINEYTLITKEPGETLLFRMADSDEVTAA